MVAKLLTVNNICSLLVVIRLYYTFTIDTIDETHLKAKPCDIAKSYVFNDTSHIIPISTNTSIIYPLLSCVIPYKLISIYNHISPYKISESYNLIHLIPKFYSFEVSLFIQACFVRICNQLNVFDINACKLLYCSSMITLSLSTHNITSYPLQLNILIVFIWFILESRQYIANSSYQTLLLILRNMICGVFVTVGAWVNILFIFYAYPYIIFVFIDNAILWKTKSTANMQKSVSRTTLNLSLWSTFFALAIIITSFILLVNDIQYFSKPRMVPLEQYDGYWDENNYKDKHSISPLYTHLIHNMSYLYSFLFFYLIYFIYQYKVRGLEVALFYSNEIAMLISNKTFQKKKNKDFDKQLKSPAYMSVFYYALLLNLFSSICVFSLFSYQSYQLLIPLLLPIIILSSAVFKPWLKVNEIERDNEKSIDDKTKLMKFMAAVRGKDMKGNQLSGENKIHILMVMFWFVSNIVAANWVSHVTN